VGDAVRNSGLPRKELFVTTKIMSPGGSPEATYEKLLGSVRKISGDGDGAYVDLFLIHHPGAGWAGRKETWLALERLLDEGKTRSIGVSNYGVKHIEEMKAYAKVWPPHVNQLEVSFVLLAPPGSAFSHSFTHGASRRPLIAIARTTASSWRHTRRW
jgi:diketogulonate reductase-like aldo/keto reductase